MYSGEEYCMQQIAFIHCPGKIEWNREIWQANLAEQYHSFLLQLLNNNNLATEEGILHEF